VAAIPPNQAIITYKPATFHTVDMDNNYLYTFEDIQHLLIIGRYSGATLPKHEILFRFIFERGQSAIRELLQAYHAYAVQAIRKRLGIELTTHAFGDPVTVVTKKYTFGTEWFLTGDIRERFSSKCLVLTAYEQQQAPVKNKEDTNSRILTHDGHISPTIIPTRHVDNESTKSSLHKYLSHAIYSRARTSESSRRYSETTSTTFTKTSS